MKARYLLAALLPIAAACYDETAPHPSEVGSPAEVVLKVGEQVRVDAVLSLAFLGVPADSRCPSLALCIWAGDGAVQIAYAAGMGPSRPDTLHTTLDPKVVQFAGYAITLVELGPYPATSDPIPQSRYEARFKIERLTL
jgi:hypothetical protein